MKAPLLLLAILFLAAAPRSLSQWVQTGGPEGGSISSLAEDDSFFYAATFGPTFRRQKSGEMWVPLPQGARRVEGAPCLLVNGSTLYAGNDGGGVFWSKDHGVTWNRWVSGLDSAQNVFSLAVRGNDLYAGTNRGVYLSTDGGTSWTAANAGQDSLLVLTLLFKDTILFAGTWTGGVYRSTDYGAHWSAANNGLTANAIWSLAAIDTELYAGTWWGEGVYRSTDNGLTWQVFEGGPYKLVDVSALAVMGRTLLAGTVAGGVFRSRDGSPWELLSGGPVSTACFHVAGTQILAGTGDGVYVSPDTGESWNAAYDGLTGSDIRTLLCDGTHLFAGASGLFRSDDRGGSWTKLPYHLGFATSLVITGSYLFAGSPWGISRSTNSGNYWEQMWAMESSVTALAVLAAPGSNAYLFAGCDSSGVSLSTNLGTTWTRVNSGLTDTSVHCLAVIDTDLFAGTSHGVFRSTDRGASWHVMLSDGLIACLEESNGDLFAGTEHDGVYRSEDRGATWSAANNGLTDGEILCLAASGMHLFAGTRSGRIFLSENRGSSWVRVDTGYRPLPVQAMALDDEMVYAGSRGHSVWRRALQEMITAAWDQATPVPAAFGLDQNYPNPFNPVTVIGYELPAAGEVRLSLFDILGREVACLVNGRESSGRHTVRFDGSKLATGVYIYRLSSGTLTTARKCLVLK